MGKQTTAKRELEKQIRFEVKVAPRGNGWLISKFQMMMLMGFPSYFDARLTCMERNKVDSKKASKSELV